MGADGIIIFKYKDNYKVSIFEAKFPKITESPEPEWDYMYRRKKSSPLFSHFSEQLIKQSHWSSFFAIWEMFQNGYPNSSSATYNFLLNGPTCVWHQDAYNYFMTNLTTFRRRSKKRVRWRRSNLQNLFSHSAINLSNIIYNILICNKGQLLNAVSTVPNNPNAPKVLRVTPDTGVQVNIPVPKFINNNVSNSKNILTFMGDKGITRYFIL
ncbi:hypothetical protein IM538_14775 [Cytobacillus suaedae]|nr:hypothetical protein IM538_14775 [Cytobacillus suaedae]